MTAPVCRVTAAAPGTKWCPYQKVDLDWLMPPGKETLVRMSVIVISRVTRLPSLGNTQSTPSAVSEQSNVSVEQEQEHRQGQVLTAVTRLVLTEILQAAGLIMT